MVGVAEVVAVGGEAVAGQFVPAGDRPDVGGDVPVLVEEVGGAQGFGHGDAGGQDLGGVGAGLWCGLVVVDAA